MSFFVLKRISGNSEENLYSMLPNCSSITKLQFGNIKYWSSSEFPLILFKTKNDISVTPFKTKNGWLLYVPDGIGCFQCSKDSKAWTSYDFFSNFKWFYWSMIIFRKQILSDLPDRSPGLKMWGFQCTSEFCWEKEDVKTIVIRINWIDLKET